MVAASALPTSRRSSRVLWATTTEACKCGQHVSTIHGSLLTFSALRGCPRPVGSPLSPVRRAEGAPAR